MCKLLILKLIPKVIGLRPRLKNWGILGLYLGSEVKSAERKREGKEFRAMLLT